MSKEKNHVENNKKWRENNKEKVKAHSILNEYVRNGRIIKPNICEICKEEKKVQGHHEDYSKPLDVIWVCSKCHHEIHKRDKRDNNKLKEKKKYVKKGYNNYGKSKPYKKPLYFDEAKKLRELGMSYDKISEIIGVSKSQIYKWLNNTPYN